MSFQGPDKSFKKPYNKFRKNGYKSYGHKLKNQKNINKRFLTNVKGFAKNGNYGRGTHIEEEDFTYFMGILEAQQKAYHSLDDKVNMASNVMEQTISKEVHLSSNQVVSKVIENIIGFVDGEHLERFFEAFGENFRPVISDIHASHVLEKMIETALLRSAGQSQLPGAEEGASEPKKPKREIVTDLKYNTTQDFTQEHRNKCTEFVLRISKFLLNNLEDFVDDRYGNHLLRGAILALAGVHIPKADYFKGTNVTSPDKYGGLKSGHHQGIYILRKTVFKVPDEWIEVLKEFPERLSMWPQFKDLPYKYRTSGLLQVICIALRTADEKALYNFGKKLCSDAFIDVKLPESPYHDGQNWRDEHEDADINNDMGEESNESVEGEESKPEPAEVDESEKIKEEEEDNDEGKPSVFKSDAAIRLLQTLIAVATPKVLTKVFELFNDRLVSLANGKFSYYAVERMVNYVVDKSDLEVMFNELSPHFEKFILANKSSLMSAFSGACLRLKALQGPYVAALQQGLHCTASEGEERPKLFFLCLTKLKTFDVLPTDKHKYVTVFGSLIIQDILCFNKPISMVNCILETPVKDLIEVLQFSFGSFIADKFLSSPTIGEKSRDKFVKLFEGFYMDFAVSKHGSRVLESLLKSANDGQKVAIATELTGKDNQLKGAYFGRIIYNSLRLDMFKLSPEQWKKSWTLGYVEVEQKPTTTAQKPAAKAQKPTTTAEDSTKTVPKSNKRKRKNRNRPAYFF